jgi:hypothetical protein
MTPKIKPATSDETSKDHISSITESYTKIGN